MGSCTAQNFSDENGNLMELTEHEIGDKDWIVPISLGQGTAEIGEPEGN